MSKSLTLSFLLGFILLLVACAAPPPPPSRTPVSAATSTNTLEPATNTPENEAQVDSPTETATAQLEASPTEIEIIEATPAPTSPPVVVDDMLVGEAEIKIYRPGPYSRVASPFGVVAYLEPGPGQFVTLELQREDGEVITRKVVFVTVFDGETKGNLVADMEFEISSVAEAGRLVISVEDEFGRIRAMTSETLVLLGVGESDVLIYGDLRENIVLTTPSEDSTITGGTVLVSGYVRMAYGDKITLELVDETGTILAVDYAVVVPPTEGEYGVFAGELSYNVEEATPVRLIVKDQGGGRIPGFTHISSMELVLEP